MATTTPQATVPATAAPATSVTPTTPAVPTSLSLTVVPPSSSVSPSEQGWTIKIKNADGTTSEMTLEPKAPEKPVVVETVKEVVQTVKEVKEVDFEKGPVIEPKPKHMSRTLRFYLIVQYILNSALAISIIGIMIVQLNTYYRSKNVAGAWPTNPVMSPTFLMLFVSLINLLFDAANLLTQCCGVRAVARMTKIVAQVRKATTLVATIGPAIAAGLCKFGFDSTSSNDFWGWACSTLSDPHEAVNNCHALCKSTYVAWAMQIVQVLFQVLSVAVPIYSKWRLQQVADISREYGETLDGYGGDNLATALIEESKAISVTIAPAKAEKSQ